jgi:hypothetical protein
MALQKTKQLPSGAICNYYRIVQTNMNYDRLDCVITLSGYLSKEARDSGATPIDSIQLDLSSHFHNKEYTSGEEILSNINRKSAYTVIKQLAQEEYDGEEQPIHFFRGATDI